MKQGKRGGGVFSTFPNLKTELEKWIEKEKIQEFE